MMSVITGTTIFGYHFMGKAQEFEARQSELWKFASDISDRVEANSERLSELTIEINAMQEDIIALNGTVNDLQIGMNFLICQFPDESRSPEVCE